MGKEKKKNIFIYSFSGVLLISLITYASVKSGNRKIEALKVEITDQESFFFTDQLEIIELMTNKDADYVIGVEMNKINPKILEDRVESNPFVKEAQVFRDLKGNLRVKVKQSKPIARLFTNGENDRYIDIEGNIMPVNSKYTARVPLIETMFNFIWKNNLNESSYGKQIIDFLAFIEADEFWKAQITHITIKNNGEIIMYPQVTKQIIEFGQPNHLKNKFSKLKIFYKKILPTKGWNHYEKVNLKFENQIICT